MIKAARAVRKIFTSNGKPNSIVLVVLEKIGTSRQIVPLIFPSDDKGRAHSAENVSIYTSFSYGLLRKKARAARKRFQIEIIFLNFA